MTTDCYGRSHPHGVRILSYGADHFPAPDPLCGADHGRTYTVSIPPLPLQALLPATQFCFQISNGFLFLSGAFSALAFLLFLYHISVLLSPASDSPHVLQPLWKSVAMACFNLLHSLNGNLFLPDTFKGSVPVQQFPLFVSRLNSRTLRCSLCSPFCSHSIPCSSMIAARNSFLLLYPQVTSVK